LGRSTEFTAKVFLIAGVAVLFAANQVCAQKKKTILGDAWTGVVVASSDDTREVTLSHPDKNKTDTFVGILAEGYKVRLKDGSQRELKVSELKPGMRIRVFYKTKTEYVAGRSVKVQRIHRVDFLGRDEYTRLREVLELPPSIPVILDQSSKLPPTDPLKIYLAIKPVHVKERFAIWVSQWNKNEGTKYGRIEIVPDLQQSDISLVLYWGGDESIMLVPLTMYDRSGDARDFVQATAQLVVKDGEGLRLLWLETLFIGTSKSENSGVSIQREIEKRMKARSN
jgi:hypothetical protein